MTEKKIKVVLVCAAGMSSSLLEEKIRKAAEAAGKEMELKAVDSSRMGLWDFEQEKMDIILVAPQVRFTKRNIIKRAEPYGVIVQDIDTIAYGMVDGEKIFAQVMEAMQKLTFFHSQNIIRTYNHQKNLLVGFFLDKFKCKISVQDKSFNGK